MNRESLSDGGLAGLRARAGSGGVPGVVTRQPTAALRGRARGWELGLPPYVDIGTPERGLEPPGIIAVGGGKGGVGKSLVAANLGARCAAAGFRVVCFDLDIGGSNLHTYFGLGQPAATLADVVVLGRRSLADCMTPTGIEGLRLVAGGRDECWAVPNGIDLQLLRRVSQQILAARTLGGADLVILDLGAGTARHTVDFFSLAHLGLLSVLPEPTSIENAYLFLRTLLLRVAANVGQRLGAAEAVAELTSQLVDWNPAENNGRPGGYADRLKQLSGVYPGLIHQISEAMHGRLVGVAVNQARSQKDIDVGRSMEVIGERYFGFPTRFCGWLSYDEAAWKSLRNQRLLVCDFPQSNLARKIGELTRSVVNHLGY